MKKGVKVWGLIAVLIAIGSLFMGIVSAEVLVTDVNKDIAATNVNVTPSSPKGDLELVRGDDETDTSTKNKTEKIKVTPTPTHDMVVTKVNTTPSSPDLEQPTVIYVTVTNEGEQQEDNVSVKVYVDSAQIGSTQYISLAPGSSNTTTFLWSPTTAKAYSVKGEVEIVNGEIDVKDNTKSIKVRVSAVPTPTPTPTPTHDMVVTNVNTTPSSPDLEQPTVIYVTVTNEGEQQEDNVSVKVYVDSAQIGSTQYISLAPGSSNITTFLWTPTTAKAYSVKGEVGIVNGEIDVKDNTKSIKVRVSAVPKPTLKLTPTPTAPPTAPQFIQNTALDDDPLHQLPATSGKISYFCPDCCPTSAWGEPLGVSCGGDDAAKYWFVAMRWPYYNPCTGFSDSNAKSWWHNKKVLVTNPANGKQVVLAVKDWGPCNACISDCPQSAQGRVVDVSKTALDALGAVTDDTVNIEFADQSAGLGLVSTTSVTKPSVVSRTGWGCPDGQSSPSWPPQYHTVTHIIIHHTATPNTDTDWPARVRQIWDYHTNTKGWGDIGYNYLIDPSGVIYEGRAGGDDVIAGHAYPHNVGTMGVAFIGTFSTVEPTSAALRSAESLLAWKCDQRNIDPLGSGTDYAGTYYNHIAGHRDVSPTACPGDKLYNLLPTIRQNVFNLINGQSPDIITPLSGDLNDDGTDSYGTFDSSTAGFTFNGKTVHFGTSTDLPVMGDWDNDGSDEIGIYRQDNGGGQSEFHLVWQDWGFFSDGASVDAAYRKVIPFGYYPNNIPIAGDWDGINNDDIGGFCNNKFYLYTLNWGSSTATPYAGDPSLGDPGDKPIIGDWDGDGDDDIGVFRAGADTNYFYLEGYLEFPPYSFGNVGDEPLIGDWDGDGDDDIGVYRPGDKTFHPNYPPSLSNGYVTPSSGYTSTTFDYYVTYTDTNNDEPTTKYVYVDGSPQTMTKISGSYTSGATFKYSTTLSAGSHNYYFYFDDGCGHTVRLPTSGTRSGPTVSTPQATVCDYGVFSGGLWFVDTTGDHAADYVFGYGFAGATPLVGDIDQDGTDDIAIVATYGGNYRWFVDTNGDHVADEEFWFGFKGAIPLVGDINQDGTDDIAIVATYGGNYRWFVDTNGDHVVDEEFWFGFEGTTPLVGDIDQDGTDDIALVKAYGGNYRWFVDTNGDHVVDKEFWFGFEGAIPLVGDIDRDSTDDIALVKAYGGNYMWLVDTNFDKTVDQEFWFGFAGATPLVGDIG